MKEKVFITGAAILLVAAIIGLNIASYTQKDTLADTEIAPNRSTYNSGATGARALYEFLAESGKNVTRRQESFINLPDMEIRPETIVIIGETRLKIEEGEAQRLFEWVSQGGRLILIDRNPPEDLLKTTAPWMISNVNPVNPDKSTDPADQTAMTEKTAAARPLQPTVLTQNINAVQPSRFAASAKFEFVAETEKQSKTENTKTNETETNETENSDLPPPPVAAPPPSAEEFPVIQTPSDTPIITANESEEYFTEERAPFVHLANGQKNILVDFQFGEGQIIWLTDPFIVSNGGIGIVDNLQAALNIIGAGGGQIAFDEYHHGYGEGQNRVLQYFAETPVFPIFGQIALLLFLILFAQSRRFARALPAAPAVRLSKLEYVSAFAELQERTKAYDLAIENIYTDFRRRAAALFAADNFSISRKELAHLIAERAKIDEQEIYNLLKHCEEIIQGAPVNKKDALHLAKQIRETEERLKLKRIRRATVKAR